MDIQHGLVSVREMVVFSFRGPHYFPYFHYRSNKIRLFDLPMIMERGRDGFGS